MAANSKYTIPELIERNRGWVAEINKQQPDFFEQLGKQQNPDLLWIGCSDSRVPANQVVGLVPGEVFVHRNVANQVLHVDFNCLAVMQYAVEVIRVSRIIVCGHYGCGGVKASLKNFELGLIDNWLYGISALKQKHQAVIDAVADKSLHSDVLCEINVIEQVRNVCHTSIVQGAWRRGQDLSVHGLIYGINDGNLNDLGVSLNDANGGEVDAICDKAIASPRLVHRGSK